MKVRSVRPTLAMVALFVALLCMTVGAGIAPANPGGDNISSAIPSALPLAVTGSLDSTSSDVRDVYAVTLSEGQTLDVSMVASAGTDFDLMLYRSSTTNIDETSSPRAMWSSGPTSTEHFTYVVSDAGTYYIDVHAWAGAGGYSMNAQIVPAVKFTLGGLTVPKSAKKGKKVKVSAWVTPSYNGSYSPIYFQFSRYENKKYKEKAFVSGSGKRNPGQAKSILTYTYKFPKKGKWRVTAFFWDEAHKAGLKSKPKYITIK
jgi:hypothetical protein